MATEGQFPKVDGDVLYASEVNKIAGVSEWASGIPIAVSAGSSTTLGCWLWTNGSLYAPTDGNLSTYWAGSFLLPQNGEGSVVLDLGTGLESYRRAVLFTGSWFNKGYTVSSPLTLKSQDSTGSTMDIWGAPGTSSVGGEVTGSYCPITGGYKTRKLVFNLANPNEPGSVTLKIFDMRVI